MKRTLLLIPLVTGMLASAADRSFATWSQYLGGADSSQYSSLKQINKSNVKRLVPIWSTSLSNDSGELGQPTIYNGVMYVVNGNWTAAIDVATGQPIWRTPAEYGRRSP